MIWILQAQHRKLCLHWPVTVELPALKGRGIFGHRCENDQLRWSFRRPPDGSFRRDHEPINRRALCVKNAVLVKCCANACAHFARGLCAALRKRGEVSARCDGKTRVHGKMDEP